MSHQLFVLILAGGSGERFWPLSRQSRPKQLLKLFSDRTMLEDTIARLDGLVPSENILILTNALQEKSVRETCTTLPAENIIAEPAKRDTAAAIALASAWVSLRDPVATMVVLPADHLIKDTASFQSDLRIAAQAAEKTGDLVTIGIPPTWPCPSFGYIEQGDAIALDGVDDSTVYEVSTFREKPDAKLAERFLQQGHFRWNAGMFIWSVNSIITEFTRHTPELGHFICALHESNDFLGTMNELFPNLPKVSIDYAVMEKADRVLEVEASFDWDDVGTWTAVSKYFPKDEANNISNCPVVTEDSAGNFVYSQSGKQIALLGVHDLIVIEADDALMVCRVSEAEKVKAIVQRVPKELQ